MTIAFAMALAIIVFLILPGSQRVRLFAEEGERPPLTDRVARWLKLAGVFDGTPSLFVVSVIVVSAVTGLVIALATGEALTAIFGPPLVIFGTQFYIYRRQRRFVSRAIDELVPFLNRMAAAAKAGLPPQQAYLDAVAESNVLRDVLGESAAKVSAGAPFIPTLVETLPELPLRMWATFVRQVELYEQTGGDVASGLERTVTQVNQMLQLQSEARAQVATQARQQHLIIALLVAGLAAITLLMEGGWKRVSVLFTDPAGIIMGLIGLSLMLFGVWFLNKQIRDIERKLAF